MKVVLQMVHNNPPVRTTHEAGEHGSVWCYEAWGFQIESAAEIAGGLQGVARAYDSLVVNDTRLHNWPPLPEGPDTGYAVFRLMGTDEQFRALVQAWAREIRDDLPNVGGDDSHYDYFPDYVEGFRQLCHQINYPEAYNETLELILNSHPYANDPETPDLFGAPLDTVQALDVNPGTHE